MKRNQRANDRKAFEQAIIWADGEELKMHARRMLEELNGSR